MKIGERNVSDRSNAIRKSNKWYLKVQLQNGKNSRKRN
jgi:hypothetical protein